MIRLTCANQNDSNLTLLVFCVNNYYCCLLLALAIQICLLREWKLEDYFFFMLSLELHWFDLQKEWSGATADSCVDIYKIGGTTWFHIRSSLNAPSFPLEWLQRLGVVLKEGFTFLLQKCVYCQVYEKALGLLCRLLLFRQLLVCVIDTGISLKSKETLKFHFISFSSCLHCRQPIE